MPAYAATPRDRRVCGFTTERLILDTRVNVSWWCGYLVAICVA